MKKQTQLNADFSAYFFALILTAMICAFFAALYYVELCAHETLLSSGGMLYGASERIMDLIDSYL